MNEAKVAIKSLLKDMVRRGPDLTISAGLALRCSKIWELLWRWSDSRLGQSEYVCYIAQISHLPHSVGGITGAVLVTDETIETWGTESFLAVGAFKPRFTQAGPIDMMTLCSILTLTLLVTQRTKATHRTVFLTPGGQITLSFKLVL